MRILSQLHDGIHLKILPTLLEVFLRHLTYCRGKAFNEAYDKINEFSNFKYILVSWFDKLQDTATELGSGDTFLRTWNFLLNYNQSLNIQFNSFLSIILQSNSKKIHRFQLVDMVNHSGLPLSNVLHILHSNPVFLYLRYFFATNLINNFINTTLSS